VAKESEQGFQDNGMTIQHLEAERFLLVSLRNPMNVHLVDLEEYDGYGECSCEYFTYMIAPKLKLGKKPFKQCRHLRSAKRAKAQNLHIQK
jgi:hypothetical protein